MLLSDGRDDASVGVKALKSGCLPSPHRNRQPQRLCHLDPGWDISHFTLVFARNSDDDEKCFVCSGPYRLSASSISEECDTVYQIYGNDACMVLAPVSGLVERQH
jgi:hypothetical protein